MSYSIIKAHLYFILISAHHRRRAIWNGHPKREPQTQKAWHSRRPVSCYRGNKKPLYFTINPLINSNLDEYVLKVAGRDSYIHGNYELTEFTQTLRFLCKQSDIELWMVKKLDVSLDLPREVPDVSYTHSPHPLLLYMLFVNLCEMKLVHFRVHTDNACTCTVYTVHV